MKKRKHNGTKPSVNDFHNSVQDGSYTPQIFSEIKFENSESAEGDEPQVVIISKKQKQSPEKRVKRVFKTLYPKIIGYSILIFLGVQSVHAYIVNHRLPPVEPDHTYEDYFDDNGNDFDVDDKNQIVVDKTTPEEKAFLTTKFEEFILQDANTRNPDANISKIENIRSISLVPFNLCPDTNEYDKYYISFLFEDDKKELYTLNYLTGKDFESEAELSKDYFTDCINYLSYDCALDSCQSMSEKGEALKNILGPEAVFVGDPYLGYSQSGAEAYYIPVYTTGGADTTFYSLASQYYDEDPMDKFQEMLTTSSSEFEFIGVPFEQSENLQKFLNLINDYKQAPAPESQNQENEKQ